MTGEIDWEEFEPLGETEIDGIRYLIVVNRDLPQIRRGQIDKQFLKGELDVQNRIARASRNYVRRALEQI